MSVLPLLFAVPLKKKMAVAMFGYKKQPGCIPVKPIDDMHRKIFAAVDHNSVKARSQDFLTDAL